MTHNEQSQYEKRRAQGSSDRYSQQNQVPYNNYNPYHLAHQDAYAEPNPYNTQFVSYTGYAPQQANRQFKQPLQQSIQTAQPVQRPYPPVEPQQPPAKASTQPGKGKGTLKRSKAESLALVTKLKKWSVAASVLSFGTLSVLVAGHVTGVTNTATAKTSSKTTVTTPSTSSSQKKSYLQQTPTATSTSQPTATATSQPTATPTQSTTSNQGGGYGIGGSTSTQSPVTSSHTS